MEPFALAVPQLNAMGPAGHLDLQPRDRFGLDRRKTSWVPYVSIEKIGHWIHHHSKTQVPQPPNCGERVMTVEKAQVHLRLQV